VKWCQIATKYLHLSSPWTRACHLQYSEYSTALFKQLEVIYQPYRRNKSLHSLWQPIEYFATSRLHLVNTEYTLNVWDQLSLLLNLIVTWKLYTVNQENFIIENFCWLKFQNATNCCHWHHPGIFWRNRWTAH